VNAAVLALALTALAGAATTLGGVLAAHRSLRTDGGLAVALAFAAGAMVLVSVVEVVPTGAADLTPGLGAEGAWAAMLLLVVVGAGLVVLLGRAVGHGAEHGDGVRRRVRRSAVVVAVAVAAHNLPEGLATFVATLEDPAAGATLAVAIALHNVPEGVAVAAPLIASGATRRRAVGAATLSGLAEPLGALLGFLVLVALLPAAAYGAAFGVLFGLVAGVMLHLGLTELLPGACRLAAVGPALAAAAAGGATMVASIALLGLA
jgi:zinc transporter, ZIP family